MPKQPITPHAEPTAIAKATNAYLHKHALAGVVPTDVILRAYADALNAAGELEAMLARCEVAKEGREAFARERMAAAFEDSGHAPQGAKSWTAAKASRTRRKG